MYLPLCGEELEVKTRIVPQRAVPIPPNNLGKCGRNRVLQPLCGEGLEGQSYPTPARGVPTPETVQARPERLGCIRRCSGGARRSIIPNSPTWAPLSR